ncbi:hypothetical protein QYE76_040757 [Lolium multiflorum]|uniref:CCHC-type domain-containing protein n=1 Tax=Lolium multiflorum TaxID=4521 RepID=A0AAD8WTH2_LOLMU|nr:hypothetical protein QYE76_040757 [Lolium multiflorum]
MEGAGGRGGRGEKGSRFGVEDEVRRGSIYNGARVLWVPWRSSTAMAVQGAKGQGDGGVVLGIMVELGSAGAREEEGLDSFRVSRFKKQGKPNNKGNFKKGGKKVAAPPEKPKAGPKPDTVCYYCKEKGHWKRNCSKYLADLKSGLIKKKGKEPDDVVDEEGDALGIPKLRRLSLLKICEDDQGIPKLRAFTPLDHSISYSSLDP